MHGGQPRHHADPDALSDFAAYRLKAAQPDRVARPQAQPSRMIGKVVIEGASTLHADKFMRQHFGIGNPGAPCEGWSRARLRHDNPEGQRQLQPADRGDEL